MLSSVWTGLLSSVGLGETRRKIQTSIYLSQIIYRDNWMKVYLQERSLNAPLRSVSWQIKSLYCSATSVFNYPTAEELKLLFPG